MRLLLHSGRFAPTPELAALCEEACLGLVEAAYDPEGGELSVQLRQAGGRVACHLTLRRAGGGPLHASARAEALPEALAAAAAALLRRIDQELHRTRYAMVLAPRPRIEEVEANGGPWGRGAVGADDPRPHDPATRLS